MTIRKLPNIIITGTPGVGKTTHCQQLAEATELSHLDINNVVKEKDCVDSYDEELHSTVVDEDKLLDAIDKDLENGGQIIDWLACDLFPQSKIDLVVVLRCDTEPLYDRLTARGYGKKKLDNDMDAEIMQVTLQEARDAYDQEIVIELFSDTAEQIDENVSRIETWVKHWVAQHPHGVESQDEPDENADPDAKDHGT